MPLDQKFTNFASGNLQSGITTISTTMTLVAGDSVLFPVLGAGEYFYCVLKDQAGVLPPEVVTVTATSGSVFTISRGQDNTSASNWAAGTEVLLRWVNASVQGLYNEISNRFVLSSTLASSSGSSLVGYIQSGTGATARTVQARLREIISVKDFGAVGNGVTNDTTAIQNAINACIADGGGIVFFPTGTYLITGTLTIGGSGVILEGESTTGCTIKFNNGSSDSIYFYGSSAPGIYNCQLRDITLEHTGKTGGAAIKMYRANQCQVSRVNINNCWNAFDLKTINNVIIDAVVAAGILGSFGCKFWSLANGTERSDVLTMNDTVFNMSPGGKDGIVWDGFAHTLRLNKVGVLGARYGLLVQNTAVSGSYYPSFGEFFDLEIDGTTGQSVRLEGGSIMAFNGCELFNLEAASGPIFYIASDIGGSYTNGIRFNGGSIRGGSKEAIYILGRDVIIEGAIIGGGNSVGFPCVYIGNNAQDIIITGNKIGTYWGGYTNKYTYGVVLEASTYRTVIDDNSFYGCLAEVNNLSTTSTVVIGRYINRSGIPNEPDTVLHRSDNNTGIFDDSIVNASTGAGVVARRSYATGTANSYVISALKDNAGSPFFQTAPGPAVTAQYQDFPAHYFRTTGSVNMFSIGAALPAYANDAAAAAGSLPLYGYYWSTTVNAVVQRRV